MLTKSDLKAVKQLIDGSINSALKNRPTKDDLKNLATKIGLRKLDKKLDDKFTDLFDLLDKDVMENKKKLRNIEHILNIPSVS